jgi:hypothetical protein
MLRTAMVLCSALTLGACSDAQKSSEVAASYVPTSKYENMSCRNLRVEGERLRASLGNLEASVDKAYKQDKNMEAVTWILFWPAAFAMDGNDAEARQLSAAKGEAEAIRAAQLNKGCKL